MGLGTIQSPVIIIFSYFAVVIGMVSTLAPFIFLPLYAGVEKLDRSIVEASFDLGANRWQTFRRVILPLTMPGVIGGSFIVFFPIHGNFIVPYVLCCSRCIMIGKIYRSRCHLCPDGVFYYAPSVIVRGK